MTRPFRRGVVASCVADYRCLSPPGTEDWSLAPRLKHVLILVMDYGLVLFTSDCGH